MGLTRRCFQVQTSVDDHVFDFKRSMPFRQKGIANRMETTASTIPNSPANHAALPVSTVIESNSHWIAALWQAWSIAAGQTDPVFNRSHAANAPVAMIMTVKQRRANHFGAELL